VPVIGYDTWTIPGIELAANPDLAVTMALERASAAPSGVDARD
jgi:hypothetical protein